MKHRLYMLGALAVFAAAPVSSKNHDIPMEVSLKQAVQKLVSFGTRHTLSSPDNPKRGIGAARRWAASELSKVSKNCGGCLKVENIERRFDGPRAPAGVNVIDVLGILPGKRGWDHVVIISGHIDSRVSDVMNATSDAPGANDDASGTALVMEAAKMMAVKGTQYEATIVFAVLSGEEQGLWGGKLLADTAKERGWKVSAMLNNDIVGNTVGTDGRVVSDTVRVFSEGIRASEDLPGQLARRNSGGEDDGPSRALMRYVEGIAQPASNPKVFGVRRPDRFGRGGDHFPALELGFPAIRFSVGVENYNHQHQDLRTENGTVYGDTVDKMDFDYLARVTRLNILTAAQLAIAPPAPEKAVLAGAVSSDTKISWTPVKGDDVIGYRIVYRRADEQDWQAGPFVEGRDASEYVFKGKIVDDHFFGVAALNPAGQSIVTFAGLPPRP
jgi:hypothetical protein